jgi:hypothetical protein
VPKRGKNWKPPAQRRPAAPEGAPPTRREERRAEAEQRRLAIQRAAARRRRLKMGAVVASILVVGGGVAAFALTRPATVSSAALERRFLADTTAAETAGCGSIQTIDPYPGSAELDREHSPTLPPLSTYPSQPPVSGPHAPIPPGPLSAGVYSDPPDIGRAIHDLEHGAVVIWYSPDAPDQAVKRVTDFFSRSDEETKVVVAPYQYDQAGGTLPAGTEMALAAWHHLRTCDQVNVAVAFQYVHAYRLDPDHTEDYKGDAPEPTSGV